MTLLHKFLIIVFVVPLGILCATVTARAATLSLSPSSGSYAVGDTVSVSVRVNAGGTAMNSAEATVSFPTDTLQLQSVSKSGSIFTFWTTEPAGSNASGRVVFSGGLPSPGYSGNAGTLIRMTFLVKATGTASLSLGSGHVLANDGLGTEILTGTGSASYTLTAAATKPTPSPTPTPTPAEPTRPVPTVSSTTHPDQNGWYTPEKAFVQWGATANRRGVSFSVTQDATTVPDDHDEATDGSAEVALPSDGVWYFHLRARYDNGWSDTAHYTLRRDATQPEPFTITLDRDRGLTDPTPTLTFTAQDLTSGVATSTMVLDGGAEQTVTSPVTLQTIAPGDHHVVITVTDRAGNSRESSLDFHTEGYPAPTLTSVKSPLILLQPIVVQGIATSGDTVVVYLNGDVLGRVVAGRAREPGVTWDSPPRVAWSLTSDRVLRPGTYAITAQTINPDGLQSVQTDPVELKIVGGSVFLGGRQIATLAVAPAFIAAGLLLLLLVILGFGQLLFWLFRDRTHMGTARTMVDRLRERINKERVSPEELDASLKKIEQDLGEKPKRSRK